MDQYTHIPHPHTARILNGDAPAPVRVADHLGPDSNPAQRFNLWLADAVCRSVGTMWCAYAFAILDSFALPQAIRQGAYGLVQWTASFFLQLVLLSIVMVNQNAQAGAADATSRQTREDVKAILAEQVEVHRHLEAQDGKLDTLLAGINKS